MPSGLFRQEVMQHRADWLDATRLDAPRIGWYAFWVGVAAVAAVLLLLLFGQFRRHEEVDGTLVPAAGLLTVMPPSAGVVTKVLVKEGALVSAGEPLIEISSASDSVAVGSTPDAIREQLAIKSRRLQADLGEQSRLSILQANEFRAQAAALQGQIKQVSQQVAIQAQRAQSAQALYDQWQQRAATGVVSKVQLLQQHDQALQNASDLRALKTREIELTQDLQKVRDSLAQLPLNAAKERNATERALADVTRSVAENEAQRATILRAPSAGTVSSVMVHAGQAAIGQQPLLTILPEGSTLLAELWVPTRAIGFIQDGEQVTLRYRAYPYQQFGQHRGRVANVSRSALTPSEVTRMSGLTVAEPRYRVEVRLDSQTIDAYGKPQSLRAGQALDADILIERRRLLEWALDPLYGFMKG